MAALLALVPRWLLLAAIAALLALALCPADPAHAQTVTAFTGVTLIDGTDRAPIANATLLVRSGRVIAAGPSARVAIPNGAERVVLTGKVIMPGIINSHGHANSAADLATYAAYGVTTLYSLGGEPVDVFAAREAQRTAPRNGTAAPAAPAAESSGGGLLDSLGAMLGGGARRTRTSAGEQMIRSAASSIGREVGRQIIRGVLGSIFGGAKR